MTRPSDRVAGGATIEIVTPRLLALLRGREVQRDRHALAVVLGRAVVDQLDGDTAVRVCLAGGVVASNAVSVAEVPTPRQWRSRTSVARRLRQFGL